MDRPDNSRVEEPPNFQQSFILWYIIPETKPRHTMHYPMGLPFGVEHLVDMETTVDGTRHLLGKANSKTSELKTCNLRGIDSDEYDDESSRQMVQLCWTGFCRTTELPRWSFGKKCKQPD